MTFNEIIEYDNETLGFFKVMYKYIAYNEVSKEIGDRVIDKDGKKWCVLYTTSGKKGFVSYFKAEDKIVIEDLYINKKDRGNNYSDVLIKYIINKFKRDDIFVIANNNSKCLFLKNGFEIEKSFKNWHHLKRVCK